MRISIVTPFFNGSRFLQETGESVLAQTHQDWEWIIVDDGSEDEELVALDAWAERDARIRWRPRTGEPKGANRCRNQGWQNASGEHILFLDGDDQLLPHTLETRAAGIRNSDLQDNEVPYFQTVAFRGDDPASRWLWDDPAHPVSWLTSLWSQTPPCQSSGPLWNRSALEHTGGWAEDIRVWQDIEIHQRAHFLGIRFIPSEIREPDVLYRIHDGSLSHGEFHSATMLPSRMAILSRALEFIHSNEMEGPELDALGLMTWSVFKNACMLRKWNMAGEILELAKPILADEAAFMRSWKRAMWSRLTKIPVLRHQLEKQAAHLFPKPDRRILSTPCHEQ